MGSFANTRIFSFLALIPSAAMVFMDQSILAVALPAIQKEFNASSSLIIWPINSYLLSMTIFLLLGGRLGTIFGNRLVHLWGIVIFAVSSAFCSLSSSVDFLSVARFFQGMGAACIIPTQVALIAQMFPPRIRGRMNGVIVSFAMFFVAIAPSIGGFFTQVLSWRWIFGINLPLAAIGMALVVWLAPKTAPRKEKIDFLGFVYFSIFCASLTIVFMQGQEWGWSSMSIFFYALLVPIFLYLLLKREKNTLYPTLNLSFFKRKLFAAINISISITRFVMMITVFRTIYIEDILTYSPSQTGVIISLTSLPVLFLAPLGGLLSDKVGPKLPLFLGYVCITTSFFWLGIFSTPNLGSLVTALILFSSGIPLIFNPSVTTAMRSIPAEKLSSAMGMVYTLRSLAATIGLSLIFAFVRLEKEIYTPQVGRYLAEIKSFSSIHFSLGCLMIVACITALSLHKRKSSHELPNSPAEGWD